MYLILIEICLRLKFLFRFRCEYCPAVCYLSFDLGEMPDYFFEKAAHNQPRIVVSGVGFCSYDMLTDQKSDFHVKVENITMCRCVGFMHVFPVMIALHFILNVAYSKKIEAKIVFLQRLLFSINDNQKIPPSC